jgi:hypothetical protein
MRTRQRLWGLLAGLAALAVLAGGPGRAGAGPIIRTFDVSWSGKPFGNNATATGQITLDLSKVNNPGITSQFTNSFVTGFTITISGASSGNGTFPFADFNGAFDDGGFVLNTEGGTLDFSKQLVGQPTLGDPWGSTHNGSSGDFNIFSNFTSTAPQGTDFFQLTTDIGNQDDMALTSFAPAGVARVPEPSTLALLALGVAGWAGWRRWRRRAA